MPPKGSKKVTCTNCNGGGTISVGDQDVPCEACNGTGTIYSDAPQK